MVWKQRIVKPLEVIARTGFLVSLMAYLFFWLTDAVQPGFVSRYFSVHIFLLSSIVFGILWSRVLEEYSSSPFLQLVVAVLCGLLLAVLTWGLTEDLGVHRVPLIIITCVSPVIIYSLIRL